MEDQDPRFVILSHSVGPPSFLGAWHGFNREESKILANVDAIFVLSEARCLHQVDCGEAFQFTT